LIISLCCLFACSSAFCQILHFVQPEHLTDQPITFLAFIQGEIHPNHKESQHVFEIEDWQSVIDNIRKFLPANFIRPQAILPDVLMWRTSGDFLRKVSLDPLFIVYDHNTLVVTTATASMKQHLRHFMLDGTKPLLQRPSPALRRSQTVAYPMQEPQVRLIAGKYVGRDSDLFRHFVVTNLRMDDIGACQFVLYELFSGSYQQVAQFYRGNEQDTFISATSEISIYVVSEDELSFHLLTGDKYTVILLNLVNRGFSI
jgi:hypothetical protein